MIRHFRIGAMSAVVIVAMAIPVGLLWATIAPHTTYVVIGAKAFLGDPETKSLIAADGWFAAITAAAGAVCGVTAYLLARRFGEITLLIVLAVGGIAAALVAWRVGHMVGLGTFHRLVRTSHDGTVIKGVVGLRATGVVIAWPLAAVVMCGLLEALDVANREPARRSAAGDGRGVRSGETDQVGGGEFNLQATPTGGDIDRREP